jgi:hypothetical protein
MRGLNKWTPANFFQALAYQRGSKVLLMLGLFTVLSLAFITFSPGQVLAKEVNVGETIRIDCSGFGKGSVTTIYCGDDGWQPAQ